MKKFTMFGLAIATIAACIGMIACTKDDATTPQEEPDFYTVKLGWGGEIVDIAYEPLDTRATTDDLYGVQVYSKPNNNSTATSWEPYAYGLFDNPTDISIDLASGNKYKFVATMVVDGKERIYNYEGRYSRPFASTIEESETTLENKFNYTKEYNISSPIESGQAHLVTGDFAYPNIERFYGELTDFVPSNSNTDIAIIMKRVSFGAKFIAEGALAKSGTLEIQISYSSPKMLLALTEGNDEISDVYTFLGAGLGFVIKHCAQDDYSETIDVALKWIRPDNTELQIGTFPITFKRNTTTVVTIKMENDVVEGDQTGGVGFSIANTEKGDMPVDEDNSVTIIDGEVEGADDSAENE